MDRHRPRCRRRPLGQPFPPPPLRRCRRPLSPRPSPPAQPTPLGALRSRSLVEARQQVTLARARGILGIVVRRERGGGKREAPLGGRGGDREGSEGFPRPLRRPGALTGLLVTEKPRRGQAELGARLPQVAPGGGVGLRGRGFDRCRALTGAAEGGCGASRLPALPAWQPPTRVTAQQLCALASCPLPPAASCPLSPLGSRGQRSLPTAAAPPGTVSSPFSHSVF